jgi:hypothetical protein
MRDDEKLEITAGQTRKLVEKYKGVDEVFPEVFDTERWVTIPCSHLHLRAVGVPCEGRFFISVDYNGDSVAQVYADGRAYEIDHGYYLLRSGSSFILQRKVSPCPK